MLRSVCFALVLAVSVPVVSQTPAPPRAPRDLAAQAAAMRDIAFLSGEWLGQGWRILPTGERVRNTQHIRVRPHGSGILATIEGVSLRQPDESARPSRASFAVISYDDRARRYLFRSFGFGELIEAQGELIRPGVFRWVVAEGTAQLRFTVDATTPNTWVETGDRSTDRGSTWTKIYQLTASKIEG
jgi:hypothetical protein